MMAKTKSLMLAAATGLVVLSADVGPAVAQTNTDRIVSALADQGFAVRKVRKTWLGRVQIEATGGGLVREVVFNPSTGEILRDFWEEEKRDRDRGARLLSNPSDDGASNGSTSNSGSSGGDDDDDDGPESPESPAGGHDDDDDDDEPESPASPSPDEDDDDDDDRGRGNGHGNNGNGNGGGNDSNGGGNGNGNNGNGNGNGGGDD